MQRILLMIAVFFAGMMCQAVHAQKQEEERLIDSLQYPEYVHLQEDHLALIRPGN